MSRKEIICNECRSEFYKGSSEMMNLCPNCAHKLYGYQNCKHEYKNGRCINCGWNGQVSEYLEDKT